MRIAKMGKRCMFVEIFIDDEKSDGIYFGREPLWCSSCTLGQDPHSENPKETENSIPPFALPPLPNPAGEIWHFSLSQSAAKIQFLKSIKNSELIFPYFPFITNTFFRKIQNGRQIMFQCDRGYSMIEGPSGATCIAGPHVIHYRDHASSYKQNLDKCSLRYNLTFDLYNKSCKSI